MATKTIIARYKDHEIKVIASKSNGCPLHLDGTIRAKYTDKVPSGITNSIMKTTLQLGKKEEIIEVHTKAGLMFKVKICIEGRYIAGDDF